MLKDPRPIHSFMQKAYEEATFKCPLKCGKNAIKMTNLAAHIKNECDLKLIECPLFGCPEKFNKY